jgi:hypothetical protein
MPWILVARQARLDRATALRRNRQQDALTPQEGGAVCRSSSTHFPRELVRIARIERDVPWRMAQA